ncbi:sucrase ferredoxin [Streptomyces zingiberis]|uniref:Sucrase ferredoxin n=1 Tax=Streptomyces zingiberis TaxID=2053010 RepID=A0ABX1BWA7_9ACTN|nr:sucrase ferredoxin [Streptomyces zingiberis]NJQ01965.1 sucrase ferredoxin [Streptomyces zingiberis]
MSMCATASHDLSEPLAGTAATARTWLLIEQPGPWGAKALTSSRLDPAVGEALESATTGTEVRTALIRRPGRHPDRPGRAGRLYLAHTAPGRSWIRTARGVDPADLPGLDFAALGAGVHDGLWEPYEGDPPVLVCTNGRRDRCCAVLGRPLAEELAAAGEAAWEVTHIGGHRFAPTLFVLPYGYAYGRVTARAVKEITHAAREGQVVAAHSRGRSCWERPGQAADLAVRARTGETGADALSVVRTEPFPEGGPDEPPGWSVTVAHTDGRAWQVRVERGTALPPRPESCGKAPGTPVRMDVTAVRELGGPAR